MSKPGWSEETIVKPDILKEIGGLEFGIVEKIHRKSGNLNEDFPFTYLDLTSGPGLHSNGRTVAGAAVTFHSLLRRGGYTFKWEMHLIEERLGEFLDLTTLLEDDIFVSTYRGPSEEIAPRFLEQLSYAPFGLICLDPNGFGVREERLIKAVADCKQARRMDWLLHLPARTIKRVRRCRDTQFDKELIDVISLTGKARGLIKRSPLKTLHDWIYLFLTNAGRTTIHEWSRRGWHDLDSSEGERLLLEANHTVKEREELPPPPIKEERERGQLWLF